jgi:hypothetical protein
MIDADLVESVRVDELVAGYFKISEGPGPYIYQRRGNSGGQEGLESPQMKQ